jgi:beta-1,4-mannosyltransferase
MISDDQRPSAADASGIRGTRQHIDIPLSNRQPQTEDMHVLMFPSFPNNPYQAKLAASLRALGIRVTLGEYAGPFSFARLMKTASPDVLHLHWTHLFLAPSKPSTLRALASAFLFLKQCRAVRRKGISIVWTVHNLRNHEQQHVAIERWGHRILTRLVDRVIVHSDSARDAVQETFGLPANLIEVIPHGNYLDSYPPVRARADARAALNLPLDEKVFLCFGHIRAYKGVERLLDTFAAWPRTKVRLIIAGEPWNAELADQLMTLAARDPRVQLRLTFVPDQEMVDLFSACDVVVLPYLATLTSGAAVLAASMGRAFIAPALGAMRDFPKDSCMLYDPEDPQALQLALDAAMEAPLESMGQSAREYAEGSPWSDVAQQTLQLYRNPRSDTSAAAHVIPSAQNRSTVR